MDEKTLLAFRMKFQSKPYAEIAKAIEMSEGSVRAYFSVNGEWKQSYDTWAEIEGKHLQGELRKAFEGKVDMIAEAMVSTFERANGVVIKRRAKLKELEETPGTSISALEVAESELRSAENRAIDIGQTILDKIGMGALTRYKNETPTPPVGTNIEDVKQQLRDAGIDPESIKFINPSPKRTEGTLPE